MKAITREEKIISGENLTPITRKEMFLAKAAGQNVKTPTPITRREMFLSKIGGGSGGEETKYYTVNFYNGDELLQSASVPQGGNAIYTGDEPVKEGDYAFTGFVPDGTNITADTDCYAQFKSTAVVSRKLVDRSIIKFVNDRITSTPEMAFAACNNLSVVDLPVITSLGAKTFFGCNELTAVILRNTTTVCTAGSDLFMNIIDLKFYIYVPSALVDSYKIANRWNSFSSRIRAIEDYPEICGSDA